MILSLGFGYAALRSLLSAVKSIRPIFLPPIFLSHSPFASFAYLAVPIPVSARPHQRQLAPISGYCPVLPNSHLRSAICHLPTSRSSVCEAFKISALKVPPYLPPVSDLTAYRPSLRLVYGSLCEGTFKTLSIFANSKISTPISANVGEGFTP